MRPLRTLPSHPTPLRISFSPTPARDPHPSPRPLLPLVSLPRHPLRRRRPSTYAPITPRRRLYHLLMPLHSDSLKASRSTLLWLIVLGAAIGLLIDIALHQIFFFAWQRQDQTWLLYAAARILDGTQLYGPRLVETNPPAHHLLSTLPAWLAAHLHLQPLLVLHSLVTLLLALTSAWSVRILRATCILRGRTATIATFALLLVAQTQVLDVDFGEREHILTLLLFPTSSPLVSQSHDHLAVRAHRSGLHRRSRRLHQAPIRPHPPRRRALPRPLVPSAPPSLASRAPNPHPHRYRLHRRRPPLTPLYFTQIVPLLRDTYPSYRGVHPALKVLLCGCATISSFPPSSSSGSSSAAACATRRPHRPDRRQLLRLDLLRHPAVRLGLPRPSPHSLAPRRRVLAGRRAPRPGHLPASSPTTTSASSPPRSSSSSSSPQPSSL